MKRIARNLWFWALLLVAATNLVALGGVAYNRSTVESEFKLSQRELTCDCYHYFSKDNSGMALRLNWRAFDDTKIVSPYMWAIVGYSRSPSWLDAAKLESLGFAKSQLEVRKTDYLNGRYRMRTHTRDVLLVLEFDGPAYQRSLERARKHAADSDIKERAQAEKYAAAEATDNSRLFVVDAGLDEDSLRARYPDVHRYAIVHGQVSVHFDGNSKVIGDVSNVSSSEINVPLEWRSVFGEVEEMPAAWVRRKADAPFDATVAFGKRLEPWLVDATKK
jgi:hypothetical protein